MAHVSGGDFGHDRTNAKLMRTARRAGAGRDSRPGITKGCVERPPQPQNKAATNLPDRNPIARSAQRSLSQTTDDLNQNNWRINADKVGNSNPATTAQRPFF
ncbi:MAG: hypothetical protein NT013_00290 [Planctomycetia bacterium]|nr:hypothetical protein [Planctomycetia bacterium]